MKYLILMMTITYNNIMEEIQFVLPHFFRCLQEIYIHTHEIDPLLIFETDMIELISTNTFENILDNSYEDGVILDLFNGSINEYNIFKRIRYIFNKLSLSEKKIVINGLLDKCNTFL
jgi:hypothetical protein